MFNPLQYIGCTASPIVTNSYQLKQDFVHSQYLYLNLTFLSHVAKLHFSLMFHLGDDCRKMTPSTYRKNTTSTIPLLRIGRVLSHSSIYYRWEYRISCRIFFTYQRLLSACAWFNMCLHQRGHPTLSCYILFLRIDVHSAKVI